MNEEEEKIEPQAEEVERPEVKKFSGDNWVYLMKGYINKVAESI